MIGKTLGGYRIVAQIGMGGMATVYKAHDPNTDRFVAIKILPQQYSKDPSFRARFEREAKAIAQLEHLHILPIFAYGEDAGISYMAMRYMDSGTLTDRIKAQGALPLSEVVKLLEQIASALDHAHAHGILHRDIKPSNVLVDSAGNAYLTDFGIAKIIESSVDLTGTGIVGTPQYMSPEQCRGEKELTPATDQYSLGVVLYEMVTGRTPYQAETPMAVIHMQLIDAPMPPPGELRSGLSDAVTGVILKALARDPQARYTSCAALAAAYSEAVTATPNAAPATRPSSPTEKIGVAEPETTIGRATTDSAESPTQRIHPLTRRIPAWVFVVALGLVATVVVLLALQSGMSATVTVPTGTAVAEAATVTPLPTETPSPQAVASVQTIIVRPPDTRNVMPCEYVPDGREKGICIFTPDNNQVADRILMEYDWHFDAPTWSPNGEKIIFSARERTADPESENRLYIVNADGSDLQPLPQINNDINPSWSPDGEWIAFHSGCNLLLMNMKDNRLITLWASRNGENGCIMSPQWSRDSLWLVSAVHFERQPDGRVAREIWLIPREGGDISRLTILEPAVLDNCPMGDVAFMPDGSRVVYLDNDCSPRLIDVDGLGNHDPVNQFPDWWAAWVYPQWGEVQ